MISVIVEPYSDEINSTILTIEGLESNKTYFKYDNSYKNEAVFVSDENGTYSWIQNLTQSHRVWIQEEKGTIFIPSQCSNYGIWDEDEGESIWRALKDFWHLQGKDFKISSLRVV